MFNSLAWVDIAWALVGYIAGSIPFGLVFTHLTGGPDLRSVGSGNIGATNVLRTGRKGLAAATLAMDCLKGTIPVLAASHFGVVASFCAAIGAFVGHVFPVWLGFKGGKGVATLIGCLFGLWWPAGLIFCGLWLITAVTTRYSSLSALVASAVTPLALFLLGRPQEGAVVLALAAVLWFRHRANIDRLLKGVESRIGKSS